MIIRPFEPDDLPELKSITVGAFNGVSIDQGGEREFGLINNHNWKWRKGRHIDDDAHRDPGGVFIAELDGRIIGGVTTYMDREAGIGHIPNIALRPESRGQGYGRRLLKHVLQYFRDHGMTHVRIETLVQNERGKHLYESLGFREIARQIHFMADLNAGEDTVDLGEHEFDKDDKNPS